MDSELTSVETTAYHWLKKYFKFPPTEEQDALFQQLKNFIEDQNIPKATFLLMGYAGTGKTTIIQSLAKTVRKYGYRTVLIAPTGRATKVLAKYSKRKAYTIHRQIYKQVQHPYSGNIEFKRRKNYQKRAIFMVDEASMISHEDESGDNRSTERTMLLDLLEYVFEHPGNKLIIIGDRAQLPPVGHSLSVALNAEILRHAYGLSVAAYELTQVIRQQKRKGILHNATALRNTLHAETSLPQLDTHPYPDIYRMQSAKIKQGLSYAYLKYGLQQTLLICASNQEATHYNQLIRQHILHRQQELEVGDLLMVVRNNYRVLPKSSKVGFLANGEFVEILEVQEDERKFNFHFVTLKLKLVDHPRQPPFESKVLTKTLHSSSPTLSSKDNRQLYDAIAEQYADIPQKSKQLKAIRKDPYLNALQVKFAYALTCHKAQGGQWPVIFVDPGYLKRQAPSSETIRWLYTACTRATQELYLIDFPDKYFKNGKG
ncbi:ATP-dependent DNA helicase [Tunicatimonas pelagia]|uniref:ATP-dependent DNA helicase n=1 Tax=Tunicatimonas pelagia TaxID=931531 RepID=UPI0026652E62|nr:DEAD/DEAH box helicase [Tunicatimonas pelagia]WKN43089.1 DEAD/DEAH box helicase [Tunicatimonas pelagia]